MFLKIRNKYVKLDKKSYRFNNKSVKYINNSNNKYINLIIRKEAFNLKRYTKKLFSLEKENYYFSKYNQMYIDDYQMLDKGCGM